LTNSNLPQDQKDFFKQALTHVAIGTVAGAPEILAAFNKVKTDTIDPHYQQLADAAVKGLFNFLSTIKYFPSVDSTSRRYNCRTSISVKHKVICQQEG